MNTIKWLKLAGLLPLGFLGLIYLAFGIGESLGTEPGGWMHLLQVIPLLIGIWLCWKFPLAGGILLVAIAFVRLGAILPELWLRPPGSTMNPGMYLLNLPFLLSGALFIFAGWLARKQAKNN